MRTHLSSEHDYSRLKITAVIGDENVIWTSGFENIWSQIKQMYLSIWQLFEVVGHGIETQFKVGEKLNNIM